MAIITPYKNHEAGNILIDETIRNETAKNSISKGEVSDAVAKSMAMIDAIIRTTDNGTISYHAPSSRTSDAWYNLLKTLLENSNNYDTYTLPAVLFQPADSSTISIIATNVTVVGNNTHIIRGNSSPGNWYSDLITTTGDGGIWKNIQFGVIGEDYYVEVLRNDGASKFRVDGTRNAINDTKKFEGAVATLRSAAYGGGTVHVAGVVTLDDAYFVTHSANTTTRLVMNADNGTGVVSLVGDNIGQSTIELLNGASIGWEGNAGNPWDVQNDTVGVMCTPENVGERNNIKFTAVGHGLVAGDWVYIWSEDASDASGVLYGTAIDMPMEVLPVAEILDTNTFTTQSPMLSKLTIGRCVPMIPAENIIVSGISFWVEFSTYTLSFVECSGITLQDVYIGPIPESYGTTGHDTGMLFRNSCLVNGKNLRFGQSKISESGDGASGTHINFSGAATDMTFCDVSSRTNHHHTGTEGFERTVDSVVWRVGTPRDLRFVRWDAYTDGRISSTTVIFSTHESGCEIKWEDCTAHFGYATYPQDFYGFYLRCRNAHVIGCEVRGIGSPLDGTMGGYGVHVLAPSATIENCRFNDCRAGVIVTDRNCIIKDCIFTDCWRSAVRLSANATLNPNDCIIDNCIMDNNGGRLAGLSKAANAYIHFSTSDIVGAVITNNVMIRGLCPSAIVFENYQQGDKHTSTIAECAGNIMSGYGIDNGVTQAFMGSDWIVATEAATDWASKNILETPLEFPLKMIRDTRYYKNDTRDYWANDFVVKMSLVIDSWKDATAETVLISELNTGGANSVCWLVADHAGNQWKYQDGLTDYIFDEISPPQINKNYDITLKWDVSETELTLIINGVSQTKTIPTPSPLTTEILRFSGASTTLTNDRVQGTFGAVIKQPIGTVVQSWPGVAGSPASLELSFICTTSAGDVTRHVPTNSSPAAWFTLLKTQLEAASAGDTFSLPAVLFQPADASTIAVAATNITVLGNGARFMLESGSSDNWLSDLITATGDGGVWSGIYFGEATAQVEIERLVDDGSSVMRVAGDNLSAHDTAVFEVAVKSLEGAGGGTVRFSNILRMNVETDSVGASRLLAIGSSATTVNLIGDGVASSKIVLVNDSSLMFVPQAGARYPFIGGASAEPVETTVQKTFTSAAAHGLSVGDYVSIWSEDPDDALESYDAAYVGGGSLLLPGETHQVASVTAADTFVIYGSLIDAMTNCKFEKITPLNGPVVRDFSIMQVTTINTEALFFAEVAGARISNIAFVSDPDEANSGTAIGFAIANCIDCVVRDISFSDAVFAEAGRCIGLSAGNWGITIENITSESNGYDHIFDIMTIDVVDLDDGASGTFTGHIGTPRNITIRNWHAKILTVRAGAFKTHPIGYGILFDRCVVDGPAMIGFMLTGRKVIARECVVQSGERGFQLSGVDCRVIDCETTSTLEGVRVASPRCEIDQLTTRKCVTGVVLRGVDGTFPGANGTVIRNSRFLNNSTNIDNATVANAQIFVADSVSDISVLHNLMSATGSGYAAAIVCENYDSDTFRTVAGNVITGYGTTAGISDAFMVGGITTDFWTYTHDTMAAAAWQRYNVIEPTAGVATKSHAIGELTSVTTDWSTVGDWKMRGAGVAMAGTSTYPTVCSKGSDQWLMIYEDDGYWRSEFNGSWYNWTGIIAPKRGVWYKWEMEYDQAAGEVTLTVNGESETKSIAMGTNTSAMQFGKGDSNVWRWVGVFGVVIEQPVGTVALEWPATAGSLIDEKVKRTSAEGITTYRNLTQEAGERFAALKILLESATNGDTFVLPPVLFQPTSASTITITANNIIVVCNGARFKLESGSSKHWLSELITAIGVGGVWSDLYFGEPDEQLKAKRLMENGSSEIRITGKDLSTHDTVVFERAVKTLMAYGGGTLRFSSTLKMDFETDLVDPPSSYSSRIYMGLAGKTVNLIGDGTDNSHLLLVDDSTLLFWGHGAAQNVQMYGDPCTPDTTERPTDTFLATSHGLTVGDWVTVRSENYQDNLKVVHTDLVPLPAELHRVSSVPDANTFTLAGGMLDRITTGVFWKVPMIQGTVIRDFSVLQVEGSNGNTILYPAIWLSDAAHANVSNLRFTHDPALSEVNGTSKGIWVWESADVKISKCSFSEAAYSTSGGCISVTGASTHVTVSDISSISTGYDHIFDVTTINRNNLPDGLGTDGAKAYVTIDPDNSLASPTYATSDDELTFVAVTGGSGGDGISITYVDPGANNQVESVTVASNAITVNLATDVSGSITSTPSSIAASIVGTPAAAALVTTTGTGSTVVAAVAATNLTQGGTFDAMMGTPRDIIIRNWHASSGGARAGVFKNHPIGYGITFIGCVADGPNDTGFVATARKTRYENCIVRNSDATGFWVGAPGCVLLNCEVSHARTACMIAHPDCEVDGLLAYDCREGVALLRYPYPYSDGLYPYVHDSYPYGNYATIRNCRFTKPDTVQATSYALSSIYVADGIEGISLLNNDLGANGGLAAITCENYNENTFRRIEGNSFQGWGTTDGISDAFMSASRSTLTDGYTHNVTAAARWQQYNTMSSPKVGAVATTPIVTPVTVTDSTDYFDDDFRMRAVGCLARWNGGTAPDPCVFAQRYNYYLRAKKDGYWHFDTGQSGQADTDLTTIAKPEIGKWYEIQMDYDKSAQEITITINGETETVSNVAGELTIDSTTYFGGSVSGTNSKWDGVLGVTIEQPVGVVVQVWPASASLPYTVQDDGSFLVTGTNTAEVDEAALLAAVAAAYAKGGGTVWLDGVFRLDSIAFPQMTNVTLKGTTFGTARLRMTGAFKIGSSAAWVGADTGEEMVETPSEGFTGHPYPVGSHRLKLTEAYVENNGIVAGDVLAIWAWTDVADYWEFHPHMEGDPIYETVHVPGQSVRISRVAQDWTKAVLKINPAGDDNTVTFTAVTGGTSGDLISVEYYDPSSANASLSISVTDSAIRVTLATDGSGAITSTAEDIADAVNLDSSASTLVTAVDTVDSSGASSKVVTAIPKTMLTNGGDEQYWIYFDRYVPDVYETTGGMTPKVAWKDPSDLQKKWQLQDLVFEAADDTVGWNGIRISESVDFVVNHLRFDGPQGYATAYGFAMLISNSVDGIIRDVDIGVAGINAEEAYGFTPTVCCTNVEFVNCKAKNYHHNVTTSSQGVFDGGPVPGTRYRVGGPAFCTFRDCKFDLSGLAASSENSSSLSTHAEGWSINFDSCELTFSYPRHATVSTYAITLYSRNSTVKNCLIQGWTHGVSAVNGPSNILNNHFVNIAKPLYGKKQSDDLIFQGNTIEQNSASVSGVIVYSGIRVFGDRWRIVNNTFLPREGTDSNRGPMIYIPDGNVSSNLVITSNTFVNTIHDGGTNEVVLYVDNAELNPASVSIRGNVMKGFDTTHRYVVAGSGTYNASHWNTEHDSSNWVD